MDDARLPELLNDLREGGGMLSRWKLTDFGYLETELQAAEQQGKIVITGRGYFASIILIEDPIEILARKMCDEDAGYADGVAPHPGYHPDWDNSDLVRKKYWRDRAIRSLDLKANS